MKKQLLLAALLAASCIISPLTIASAEDADAEASAVLAETTKNAEAMNTGSVQLPNPMVPYTSYREMQSVLGFRPLVLPRAEGYECTAAYVIGGTVGDLRYQSRYGEAAKRSNVTIRTAMRADIEADDPKAAATTLSGIYSVTWEPLSLGTQTILLAKINDTAFAACWTQGEYLFTCEGENFNRWDFTHRIVYDLLDVTEHYYTAE